MKTLIFNGSPHKNGDTSFLIGRLAQQLEGEVKIVDCFGANIAPCCDCRYCRKNVGCCIKDDMQQVYEEIKAADFVVIASPVYFAQLTGSLLNVLSRLQAFYSSERFLNTKQNLKPKLGALILCGGGDGAPKGAKESAAMLFNLMNARLSAEIFSLNTDTIPARDDAFAIEQVRQAAQLFNSAGK